MKTNSAGVWGKPNKWLAWSSELDLGSLVRSRELDSMILTGPFQVKILCSVLRTRGDAHTSGNLHVWEHIFKTSQSQELHVTGLLLALF